MIFSEQGGPDRRALEVLPSSPHPRMLPRLAPCRPGAGLAANPHAGWAILLRQPRLAVPLCLLYDRSIDCGSDNGFKGGRCSWS